MKILITGASSGIGRDMARYLDNEQNELILVSKDKERLEKATNEIKCKAKSIVCDLSKEKEVRSLYEKVKDENIDFLINNAGFGLFGEFIDTDLDTELNMIDVNIKAVHILTKLFIQDFVKRDKGLILNVCSSAGFMAGPKLNTYYATKNYALKLTMAINEELRQKNSNVHICALCPGPVDTNFNKVANGGFKMQGVSSEYVAKYGIDQALKHKMIIIPTLKMKLGVFSLRLLPFRAQLKFGYYFQNKKGN